MPVFETRAATQELSTASVLADSIARRGVTHLFGLMGDGNMSLFSELHSVGVELVQVRHESAAVAMAEGFGWGSGNVGFCCVTHGPGFTHTATSLVVANRNHTPLVLIVAETPTGHEAHHQRLDQEAFARACEVPYRRLAPDEDPELVLQEVIASARELRRPIVLGIAADLLSAQPAATSYAGATIARQHPTEADERNAARVISEALIDARRPVLLAGRGALGGTAARDMKALADRFGGALVTSVPAKGVFAGHPADFGISGGLAHQTALRVLKQADLVVAVGCSLQRETTVSMELYPQATMLQVIDEPAALPRDGVRQLFGTADGTLAVVMVETDAVSPRPPWFGAIPPPAECWAQDIRDYEPSVSPGSTDPRHVLTAITALLPDNAILVIGNGHNSGFLANFLEVPSNGRCYAAHGFGSIGQCFPTAVGVALGAPGRKVVAFEGDASFMMHAAEVETAARAGADVTLFVLNDQALGTEYHRLRLAGKDPVTSVVETPDLAAVASAFGARGAIIDDSPAPVDVLDEALKPGLAVVEVRIDRGVLSHHMRLRAHP